MKLRLLFLTIESKRDNPTLLNFDSKYLNMLSQDLIASSSQRLLVFNDKLYFQMQCEICVCKDLLSTGGRDEVLLCY